MVRGLLVNRESVPLELLEHPIWTPFSIPYCFLNGLSEQMYSRSSTISWINSWTRYFCKSEIRFPFPHSSGII